MAAVVTQAITPIDQLSNAVSDLEPDSAKALRAAFETMFSQVEEWEQRAKLIKVTSIDQKHEMKLARESRLGLRQVRINAENTRKRLKEDSLRRGKAIDGIANVLKALVEPIEEYLLEQEQFAEREEEKRKEALRVEREATLRALSGDPSRYANLGTLADAAWALILDDVRLAHQARLEEAKRAEEVRIEAERIAAERREADRQASIKAEAERAERERLVKEENDRLRKEAAEREEAARVERAKAAAEKAEVEAKAKAERDAAEAEASRARAAAKKAADELAAKVAAEKAAAEKAEADRLAAEVAPDREKLIAFATMLRGLPVPKLTTEKGKAAGVSLEGQMGKMVNWIEKLSRQL